MFLRHVFRPSDVLRESGIRLSAGTNQPVILVTDSNFHNISVFYTEKDFLQTMQVPASMARRGFGKDKRFICYKNFNSIYE